MQMRSRRHVLQSLALGGLGLGCGALMSACQTTKPPDPGQSALADDGPSLRSLGEQRGLSIGTSVVAHMLDDRDYATLLGRHFSRIMPDAAGMMSILQPERKVWRYWKFDRAVDFARAHDQQVRLNALIWGRKTAESDDLFDGWTPTPPWILNGDLSRDEMLEAMRYHIESVMRQFKGQVREYIVVNEPLHGDWRRSGLNPNVWLTRIGPEYIRLAFEHAHRADPDATLILNEWGADYIDQEHGPTDRPGRYYKVAKHLVGQGTPIDGVGFQFHLEVGLSKPTVSRIVDHFAQFHELGLSTHITELDVRIREPITEDKLQEQARLYRTVIRAALESPSTNDVTLFGFTDRYSWITAGPHYDGSIWPGFTAGTMMDDDFRLYPSFEAVRDVLSP